jgi:hypothetical protein
MMRTIQVSVGPLAAASATALRTAASISVAGTVALNGALVSGGVATLDKPRRILFTSSGDDSGITFTVTGTTFAGSSATEVVTGGNATTATTVLDYATVTSIVSSGSSAGTVSIGTSGVAGSAWVRLDEWASNYTAIQTDVSGTVNYTIQQTLDDPNDPTSPVAIASVVWFSSTDTGVVNATASKQSSYQYTPKYARILLNSGSGSVAAIFSQFGVVNR